MTDDTLTPTEKNALKWVEFSERMDALCVDYASGKIGSSTAWKVTLDSYHLVKGV